MPADERAQSEVIGTVLLAALVIVTMSVTGAALLSNQSQQAERVEQPSRFETGLNQTALTITHYGGADRELSDLVLVVRQGDSETSYNLSDPAERLQAVFDTDDVFEGGESVTVTHSYTGEVRVLLIDTSAGGSVLYDETRTVPESDTRVEPTVERFDITDTSSGGDASFDVTWNASDEQGDISKVTVELINDGTVVDSAVTDFTTVATTGVNTDTLTNTSGGGEVYKIELSVTDSAGNIATASKTDTADSDIGLRPPTIERFGITDVSTGSQVQYEYTYNASDPDRDLVQVTLELFRERTGERVDNVTDPYTEAGSTGVQTGTLTDAAGSKNDGEKYRIDIVVTDLEGNDVLASATDTADGDGTAGGTGTPPSIDRFDVTDTTVTSSKSTSFDVTWEASDADGNLQNATLQLWDKNENNLLDSVTYSGGDFTSESDTGTQTGTVSYSQGNPVGKDYVIRIVVNDDEGKTGTQKEQQAADGNDST